MIKFNNINQIYNCSHSVRLITEFNQTYLTIPVWIRIKILNFKNYKTKIHQYEKYTD